MRKVIKPPARIADIIKENNRRQALNNAPFDPISGLNSIGERKKFSLPDHPYTTQYLPVEMFQEPLVKKLLKAGSIDDLIINTLGEDPSSEARGQILEQLIRIRIRYDFPFWAAILAFIKRKGGGNDCLFRINRPQRRLVERLEHLRKAGKPIRLIILKARQWGGSTCIQLYMAWLQLVHKLGLNSLIIAHQGVGSDEIMDMFDRMIKAYPLEMLHALNDVYSPNEVKWVNVGKSGHIHRVPQRKCKIKVGTAEKPNSCRGGDYNLVHLSEVGLWQGTEKKKPEDIVRSACKGVLLEPYTMIVFESTPNGVGNFFHKEYLAAKRGISQFEAIFVSWYEIEQYELPFSSVTTSSQVGIMDMTQEQFASWLYNNRNNDSVNSDREEPGTYLWWLWEQGATLEAINWYVHERASVSSHDAMASEYPSDDIEAFTFSGRKVFYKEDVEKFRPACRPPRWRGEVYGKAYEGQEALENLYFKKEEYGQLLMWQDVEKDPDIEVLDQYEVIVDVCKGHTKNADFADILVLNRLPMLDGDPPEVVAEWHGHIDMDKLAWKAAQIAAYYNNALLIIESNTLETNNTKGEAEYILTLIHDVYDNLYARKQSAEDIKEGKPRKYGYHTNVLTKKVLILNLQLAVREHLYVEREEECLNEYLTYMETEKGGFEASDGNHDDRLMTRAIGLQVCFHEMDLPRIIERLHVPSASQEIISEATLL